MSHFTVLVCLKADTKEDVQAALETALAPFDENTEMTSTIGYLEAANAYLATLDDDTWLVQVDAHI